MFEGAGIDISGIAAAAEATRSALEATRAADIPVVYLKMEHAPDLSDVGPEDGPHWIKHSRLRVGDEVVAPDGSPSRILVRDTWNTQILDSLAPEPGDVVVSKHRFSGFLETDLDKVLRGLGAKYLLVTGCTTSVCVEATVRDAMYRDYTCIVLEDCTAEPIGADLPRSNHARRCSQFRRSTAGRPAPASCAMRSRVTPSSSEFSVWLATNDTKGGSLRSC
jgi:ureidoacrylate peracid hydrolase